MGSGAFSPQKGPKTFGPTLICEQQDEEKEGHIGAAVAAAGTPSALRPGFPGSHRVPHTPSGHHPSPAVPSPAPPLLFTVALTARKAGPQSSA